MSLVAFRRLPAVVDALGFRRLDEFRAVGEPHGVPAALLVLVQYPLSLMVRFRINPQGTGHAVVDELRGGLPDDQVALSIEGDALWLTLYNAEHLPEGVVPSLVEHVSSALAGTDLLVPPGCQLCQG